MNDSLDIVLKRLRDGHGTPEDLARARTWVRADDRLPEDLRAVVFADDADTEADAAGVLAVLGLDDLGATLADAYGSFLASDAALPLAGPASGGSLADAVMAEAREIPEVVGSDEAWESIARVLREGLVAEARGFEVAESVLRRLPAREFAHGALVSPAVTAEAGQVDLSAAVLAGLGEQFLVPGPQPGEVPVAEALWAEAAEVDVADLVLAELGLARLPVREAVRQEAGRVDVVGGVMATIGAWRVDEVVERAPARPANRWGIAGFALAAVALLSVVVGRLAMPMAEVPLLLFASAAEVHIEDLDVAADVQVALLEGDGGAVILWLDEEA